MTLEVENGTLCPNCKKKGLVPARTKENRPAIDGMKCRNCGALYRWSESHHLIALVTPPTLKSELVPATTHTAEILKPSPVKPETLEKAAQIAKKSLNLKTGRIEDSLYAEVIRRCAEGETPRFIAAAIGYEVQSVYKFRATHRRAIAAAARKLPVDDEIKPRIKVLPATKISVVTVEEKPQKVRPPQVYNSSKGNIMSQMARLYRGELHPSSAAPVLSRYKEMLEADLKATQSKAKEIKKKIEVTDEALHELDVIHQGEKAAVDKVLASVR